MSSELENAGEPQTSPASPALVPCAHCSTPTDALRAARVAIFYDRFRYFCSADCREHYDPEAHHTPIPRPRRSTPRGAIDPSVIATRQNDPALISARHQSAQALEQVAEDESHYSPSGSGDFSPIPDDLDEGMLDPEVLAPTDVGALLLGLSTLGGLLSVALTLAGTSSVALTARLVIAVVALVALVAEYVMGVRDPTEPHPAALLAAPVGATLSAAVAQLMSLPRSGAAITLAGLIIAGVGASVWLMQRARRGVDAEREQLSADLNHDAERVVGDEVASARALDLRPGEEIVLSPGDVSPVDATVTAGTAQVLPWRGARAPSELSEGDPLVAGAQIVEGRLRVVVAWAGYDRAFIRLTNDPRRRADLAAPLARVGRLIAERAAPIAAGLTALTGFAANLDGLSIAMCAMAAQSAIAHAGLAGIGSLHVARNVLESLSRGIAFRTADAFDRAGRVTAVAFCARGTLLLGEPELANIDALGDKSPEDVLALVAGAESGATHPMATAVLRAARSRGVRPDGVRSPDVQPGLGVTAVASNGQPLVVGSRALMLRERISVASAEPRINDLEAMGRSVLLVGLGGRLVGVVGMQDGLRPGARAAVQHLLDVGVEPVLLSGDARETCEALGRALDIEHIRPELLPTERGEEIRRLADSGALVAVVGKSPADDVALGAADLSIALGVAGSSTAEWHVQLASDDVRDAAYAVRLAHRSRVEARLGLGLTLAPGAAGALAVAFSLAPPALAPLAALGGTLAALLRLRSRR